MLTRRQGNGLAACACAAALAFAFYAQYGMGLVPCHLCIFQRVALAALGIAFLVATFLSRPGGRGIFCAAPRFLDTEGVVCAIRSSEAVDRSS